MKIEFEKSDIEAIAEAVANRLKSFITTGNVNQTDHSLLDIKQLMNYLNVKRDWVYQKVHNGILPHYKIEGLLRFKRSEIDEKIKKQQIEIKKH